MELSSSNLTGGPLRVTLIVLFMFIFAVALPVSAQDDGAVAPQKSEHTSLDATQEPTGASVTVLSDGRRMVVGGLTGGQVSNLITIGNGPDVVSPPTAPVVAHLIHPRHHHTATVLPDGRVAVVGGEGVDGNPISVVEIVDPSTGETQVINDNGIIARSRHSATLLSDGTVLIAGGVDGAGSALAGLQLWDPKTFQIRALNSELIMARQSQVARILPNGNVLLWGGVGESHQTISGGELIEVPSFQTSLVSSDADPRLSRMEADSISSQIAAITPSLDATNVPVESRVVLRPMTPLLPTTASQVSLVGPSGAVPGKVITAESGRLVFFTPAVELLPSSTYTVFLRNLKTKSGDSIPFASSSFTTTSINALNLSKPAPKSQQTSNLPAAEASIVGSIANRSPTKPAVPSASTQDKQETAKPDEELEDWLPGEKNRHGSWRVLGLTGDPALSVATKAMPALTGARGQTAVSGQVLRYNGKPLVGVAISVKGHSTVTDETGRFVLSGVPAGVTQVKVDGTGINGGGRHYTTHFIRAELTAGATTSIPNPIYLPRVDPSSEVNISSPTAAEVVLTHPSIPGLEVHIPKGVVLREFDGKIVQKVSITPIPLDRPPYPTPTSFSVYFTLQPGGAFIDGSSAKSIRVIYPNYTGLPAGTRADFWNYDPAMGWQVYGQGTVSKDGKQVVPDANVGFRQVISFGMGIGNAVGKPSVGPPINGCVKGGDPVDCATGLFLHTETDLSINDIIPISVTRTYRQNDPVSRAFGIGTNLSYNMFLYTGSTTSTPNEIDLVLSDGSSAQYFLESGTSLANGVWRHLSTPSVFYNSTLTAFSNSSGEGFIVTLQDKTVLQFARHSPNGLLSITDRNGNALKFSVSDPTTGGMITKVTSPSGRYIQFYYDMGGRIYQASDNIGRSAYYTYDGAGRLGSAQDPSGQTEYFSYDSLNRMTSVTDKRGNTLVINEYDANSRVSKQTLADGAIWLFSYLQDANGNVTQSLTTNPRGFVRQDTFNGSGYLTQEITAMGQPEQQTITIQRDANNIVQSVTDALGRTTSLVHDGFGNVVQATQLAGTAGAVSSFYTFDTSLERITGITDPLGHTTSASYDSIGNLSSVTDALGNKTQVTTDTAGRPLTVTDALGHSSQLSYNLGDLTSVTDALGRRASIFYDAIGRPSGFSDPLNHTTQLSYDSVGRVVSLTDPRNGTTSISYDPNGNVLTIQDARGAASHGYSYDARNRVHVYTDPLGNAELLNYDGMGNVTSRVDRNNRTTTYSYDGLDRLKTIAYGDGTTLAITWDAGNRPTQFADSANGVLNRQYDNLDRMTEESGPQGVVDYTYDAANRRTKVAVGGLTAVTYQYDAANRLTQIAQGTAASVSIAYDAANRRSSVTLPNGIIAIPQFDAANELTSLSYDMGGTHIGDLAYSYDQAGRRISQSGSLASLRLPTSITNASYDAGNRLTNWGGTPLSYDANGNLLNAGTSSYTWNTRDQLVATSDGGASFAYDALGRRTSRTISASTDSYLYDGFNTSSMSGNQILNGDGIDEVYASAGGSSSLLTDGIGSTLAITDSAGNISGSYTYGPYGNTSHTGSATAANQYSGRENDGDTNLYYYRTRYYSPTLNRFISQDPIGFGGGINVYAYAGGNPISNTDPLGLWSVTVGGYAIVGTELSFGFDNGHFFVTDRWGFGFGGGIGYDPEGGIPGGTRQTGCRGGIVLSDSIQASASLGPYAAGTEVGVFRNYTTGISDTFGSPPHFQGDGEWRPVLRGVVSLGGQITLYTGVH